MFKGCGRCGKIHPYGHRCYYNRKQYEPQIRDSEADKLRISGTWKSKSSKIIEASRYLCAVCEDNGAYIYNKLSVHHIYPLKEYPERWLDNNNLICLCTIHHVMAEKGKLSKEYLTELALRRENGTPPT